MESYCLGFLNCQAVGTLCPAAWEVGLHALSED